MRQPSRHTMMQISPRTQRQVPRYTEIQYNMDRVSQKYWRLDLEAAGGTAQHHPRVRAQALEIACVGGVAYNEDARWYLRTETGTKSRLEQHHVLQPVQGG